MILSKNDYLFYVESDRLALGKDKQFSFYTIDPIWRFQRLLRKTEYFKNCKKTIFDNFVYLFYRFLLHRLSIKLGFSIPLNCFGAGLSIAHYGTIVVNSGAKIGENCRIHVGVNIGTEAGFKDKAPKIGNNVYIGPGAKIFGDISIADGVVIGANAVVNKSIFKENITVGGIPAKQISSKSSDGLLTKGTGLINSKGSNTQCI